MRQSWNTETGLSVPSMDLGISPTHVVVIAEQLGGRAIQNGWSRELLDKIKFWSCVTMYFVWFPAGRLNSCGKWRIMIFTSRLLLYYQAGSLQILLQAGVDLRGPRLTDLSSEFGNGGGLQWQVWSIITGGKLYTKYIILLTELGQKAVLRRVTSPNAGWRGLEWALPIYLWNWFREIAGWNGGASHCDSSDDKLYPEN